MRQPVPFGKYLLLDRISVGGMAEVFKAKSYGVEGFEKIIAIKRILPTMGEDRDFIKMFIDEAKIAGQLAHANICQIFELGRIDGSHFIAMEYIWGKDLLQIQNRLRKIKQAMPIPMACFSIAKVLEGLDYAHRKRDPLGRPLEIVHRDCSPQNVLVSYEGEVKVIDFGIAKATSRNSRTMAGVLKGKFGYMSPEQVRGLPLDRRSDIFALGTMLYECLTGDRLFQGETDFSTLEKVRNVDIRPPREINPAIPEAVEAVILKALAKDVDDRYQWCSEMLTDLQAFLMGQDVVFTAKSLSSWLKDVFSTEIDRERQQLEQYKRVGRDGLFAGVPAAEAKLDVVETLGEAGQAEGDPTMLGGPSFDDIEGGAPPPPAEVGPAPGSPAAVGAAPLPIKRADDDDGEPFGEEAPTEIFGEIDSGSKPVVSPAAGRPATPAAGRPSKSNPGRPPPTRDAPQNGPGQPAGARYGSQPQPAHSAHPAHPAPPPSSAQPVAIGTPSTMPVTGALAINGQPIGAGPSTGAAAATLLGMQQPPGMPNYAQGYPPPYGAQYPQQPGMQPPMHPGMQPMQPIPTGMQQAMPHGMPPGMQPPMGQPGMQQPGMYPPGVSPMQMIPATGGMQMAPGQPYQGMPMGGGMPSQHGMPPGGYSGQMPGQMPGMMQPGPYGGMPSPYSPQPMAQPYPPVDPPATGKKRSSILRDVGIGVAIAALVLGAFLAVKFLVLDGDSPSSEVAVSSTTPAAAAAPSSTSPALVRIVVGSGGPADLFVDDKKHATVIDNQEIPVGAGERKLKLVGASGALCEKTLSLTAGKTETLECTLTPPAAAGSGSSANPAPADGSGSGSAADPAITIDKTDQMPTEEAAKPSETTDGKPAAADKPADKPVADKADKTADKPSKTDDKPVQKAAAVDKAHAADKPDKQADKKPAKTPAVDDDLGLGQLQGGTKPGEKPGEKRAAEQLGYLVITGPSGAKISVDDRDTGLTTPIAGRALPLTPGKHRVTFNIRNDKLTFSVQIKPGETTTLNKDLR